LMMRPARWMSSVLALLLSCLSWVPPRTVCLPSGHWATVCVNGLTGAEAPRIDETLASGNKCPGTVGCVGKRGGDHSFIPIRSRIFYYLCVAGAPRGTLSDESLMTACTATETPAIKRGSVLGATPS